MGDYFGYLPTQVIALRFAEKYWCNHTPAMYLIGSIGTIGIGLWVLRNHGASPEPIDEEEAEWVEYF